MSLQQKLINLKLEAALAVRHANGWQRLIDLYGESKATEFYKYLGLNHLETKSCGKHHDGLHSSTCRACNQKSYDYEGLTLSREPKEHEKLAVKGIATAQESAKESIGNILLGIRTQLISDGLKGIAELSPADYHTLTLQVDSDFRQSLRDRLISVHISGRDLVIAELNNGRKLLDKICPFRFKEVSEDDEFDDLDLLTDVTLSRITNDTQARIIAAASRLALLGTQGASLITATQTEMNTGSVSYIDRAATGLANRTINLGRGFEAEQRRDEWGRVEYSAVLDNNVCGPCLDADGETAESEDGLTPAPNPDCQGGDWCRCFHMFVRD